MRQIITCCVAVSMSIFLANAPASAATRVYVLAGQSNMMGQGSLVSELPSPYGVTQTDVKFWSNNQWVPLAGGFGVSASEFGPEVSFGYNIRRAYPNDDIYLVKYAVGSTNLINDWNPAGGGKECYKGLTSTVNAAMKDLADAKPTIAGMLWMQGESDALTGSYAPANAPQQYAANLTAFIQQVRIDFNTPNMPFVLGRIRPDWGAADNNALVRAAEETVPGQVGNATWVNTDDLQIGIAVRHYGTQGQIDLGTRFAQVLVPEPSSFVPMATGLLGLLGYGLWNRK